MIKFINIAGAAVIILAITFIWLACTGIEFR